MPRPKPRKPTLSVEHSTEQSPRAIQYPRRVSPQEFADNVNVSRPQRFRNGKLVAIAGIPISGQQAVGDSDAYAEGTVSDYVDEFVDYADAAGLDSSISAAEHHALNVMASAEASGDWETFNEAYNYLSR